MTRRRAPFDRGAFAFATLCASLVLTQTSGASPTSADRSLLYPEPTTRTRFDHKKHSKTPCVTCHASATTSTSANDDLHPSMQACATCHASDTKPTLATCNGCHEGAKASSKTPISKPEQWRAVRPAPMLGRRPKPHIKFNHTKHVAKNANSKACATCHTSNTSGAMSLPSMATCTSCHDNRAASGDCATCHLKGTQGHLKTTFLDAATNTSLRLKPTNHTVDWLKRHGPIARSQADTCTSCHTEPSCNACHDDKGVQPFQAHPPGFLNVHAVAARGNTHNCTDCHRQETFCTSCHARTRNAPQAPNRPPAKLAYHPPGWLQATAPNNHGIQARRNINDCVSCHQEQDCVSCHQGINPHPPTFRTECGKWLRADATPCAKCHQDVAALSRMCR